MARSNGRIVKVVVYGRLPRTVVHGAENVANRYVCRQDEDLEPKQFPIYKTKGMEIRI